jgi:hypothetical protein
MMGHRFRHSIAWLLGVSVVVACLLLAARPANAYPWMIRHQYAGCTPCHADPSGGGLLTEYGSAQGDLLLRTHYGPPPSEDDEGEASSTAGFLFGAIKPPEGLLLGGSIRNLLLRQDVEGQRAVTRLIQMQADLRAQVTLGRFRASGSLGFAHEGALAASITRRADNNLVSREHWVGVDLGADKQVLLRAGRMNLPFGVRSVEHTLWVRKATRTDTNEAQQVSVALSYSGSTFRGELMGIAGNYLLNPDEYRERGYSGFLEAAIGPRVSVGLSSLLTYAARDVNLRVPNLRQSHGLFLRASPWEPLVLLVEADALIEVPQWGDPVAGYAAMAQADVEIVQGLHSILTVESQHRGQPGESPSIGGWVSAAWFFAPHADVRLDAVDQLIWAGTGHLSALSLLAQLHVYL